MNLIKGMKVILYEKKCIGEDEFGAHIYEETPVVVENVIVTPTDADAIVEGMQLYGKHAVYTLCIPKEDTHKWEDAVVEFYGKKWKVFGAVKEYMEKLVPLNWNKQVKVEHYG